MLNLNRLRAIEPGKLLSLDENKLKDAIRPVGYYNQKTEYLREITRFFISLKGEVPKREDILMVRGVGEETADSILLYAYRQLEFVVDAYTRRIFSHLGLIKENAKYSDIKELIERNLPEDLKTYQEYHALIVEHGKRFYSRRPYGCQLKKIVG